MGGVRKMEGSIQCMLLWEEQRLEVNQVQPGNQGAEKRWAPGVSAWGIEDDGLGGVLGEFWINLLRHDVSDYSVVRMFLSVTHCAVSAGSVVVFFSPLKLESSYETEDASSSSAHTLFFFSCFPRPRNGQSRSLGSLATDASLARPVDLIQGSLSPQFGLDRRPKPHTHIHSAANPSIPGHKSLLEEEESAERHSKAHKLKSTTSLGAIDRCNDAASKLKRH